MLFLADMIPTAKVVGIDRAQVPPAALELASKHNLSERARYRGGIWQDDSNVVRDVLEQEFGTEPLDLIVDDASHFYRENKSTFEACFGYLRPGGRYILEDWGWAHWPDPQWQTGKHYLSGTTPLTKLVFELTMLLASRPGILSRLEIMSGSCVVATRGDELPYRASIPLDFELSDRWSTLCRLFWIGRNRARNRSYSRIRSRGSRRGCGDKGAF